MAMTRPARTVREVLIAAKWILENVGWCKGDYARSRDGRTVSGSSPEAAFFCGIGATYAVHCEDATLGQMARASLGNMAQLNDRKRTCLRDVLARFDEAIARAK
jgi:hypothetical protein